MDEALRRLERGDDRLAYAAALRRSGDEVRARRIVEAEVRAGVAGARAVLDAWYPLDPAVAAWVPWALDPGVDERAGRLLRTLQWLAGDEDPRLEPQFERLTRALEDRVARTGAFRDELRELLLEFARVPAVERRRRIVAAAVDDGERRPRLALFTLARARLDADEAGALLARAASAGDRTRLLQAIWHAGQARLGDRALGPVKRTADPIIARAASVALVRAGHPVPILTAPALSGGAAVSPVWVAEDACPVEVRCRLTAAFTRRAFNGADPPWAHEPSPVGAGPPGWCLDIDLDHAKRLNARFGLPVGERVLARVTAALQSEVGDRVCRWAGDEWLVRLEPEQDGPAVAERLREAVRDSLVEGEDSGPIRVTVSIGVARASSWSAAVSSADRALQLAKDGGRDRVVSA